MILLELRIPMPLSTKEYQKGVLFGTAMTSLAETGGGEGVEVLQNKPYDNHPLTEDGKYSKGQYTKKIYHLEKKVPRLIQHLAPKGALKLVEESWNSDSKFCKTIITNPDYMKNNFLLKIETICVDDDRGQKPNALNLSKEQLQKRKVVKIDISKFKDTPEGCDKKVSEFVLDKVKPIRGPLKPGWIEHDEPIMTVYKVVTILFKWTGLQGTVESLMADKEEELFKKFFSQVWCSSSYWYDLTMHQIRKLEDKTKQDLKSQIKKKNAQGTTLEE